MECKFWVGQKVVCVDDVPMPGHRWVADRLTEQGVYTISRIYVARGEPMVDVAEAKNNTWDGVTGYRATRFRPATDITIFKDIVAKVKTGEKVTS